MRQEQTCTGYVRTRGVRGGYGDVSSGQQDQDLPSDFDYSATEKGGG
jgi:hypothetical protein